MLLSFCLGNYIADNFVAEIRMLRPKVVKDWAHCIITKQGGESGVTGVFQEKFISFLQV